MNEPHLPESNQNGSGPNGFKHLYVVAAFVIAVAGMRTAESIINPMLLAGFLAVVCAPAYLGLIKRKVPNGLALLIVMGALSGIVLGVAWIVMSSVISFSDRQDHYAELLKERTAPLTKSIENWLIPDDVPSDDQFEDGPRTQQPLPSETEVESTESDSSKGDNSEGDRDSAESPAPKLADVSDKTPNDPAKELNSDPAPDNSVAKTLEDSDPDSQADTATLADAGEADGGEGLSETTPNSDVATGSNVGMAPAADTFGFPQHRRPPPKDKRGWEELLSRQFNPQMLISLTLTVVSELGHILSNGFLILLTVIFILLEVGTFDRKIAAAFPNDSDFAARAQNVVTSIRDYIVIKTWVSLATGILIAIWLKVLGVPYAGLWGLLAFIFNFIPNIGSVIAAVPAVLIAWLELSTLPAVAAAVGFILVNGVIGNFIEPKLMGKGLGLSPLVVFCSLIFWGWVLGPVGMLLSVPLTKTVRIALDGFDDTRFLATLLGD